MIEAVRTPVSAIMIDLQVENHGSVLLLRPRSAMGRFWIEDHIPKDAIPFADKVNGPAFIIERCYMGIVSDAIAQGLNIEQLRWIDGS
ncbi:MAG TPA: hypothetical protein VHT68_21010 [Pseudolabrys sp.]|jgi:hypothetical protein|nr:hypothetical protein [Pseudolabrys sp.]